MRLALVAAAMLAGCAPSPLLPPAPVDAPLVRLGQEFTLALGGAADVERTHFMLIFNRVAEDSRCALGTVCIWEGNARISLTVRATPTGKKPIEVLAQGMELNTSARFAQKQEFAGYVVELRRLEPVRSANTPSPPYAATLVVSPK